MWQRQIGRGVAGLQRGRCPAAEQEEPEQRNGEEAQPGPEHNHERAGNANRIGEQQARSSPAIIHQPRHRQGDHGRTGDGGCSSQPTEFV
jgi:hypothetical protein